MQQLSQFKPKSPGDMSTLVKSQLKQVAEQAALQRQHEQQSMDMKISMQLNKNISVKIQQAPQALTYKGLFQAHANTVTSLQSDPMNPLMLYSSSNDHSIKFWDLKNLSRGNNEIAATPYSISPTATITNKKRMKINQMVYHSS